MITALIFTAFLQTVPADIPPYPQRNEHTLYEQIGQCNADLFELRAWARSLTAELEKRDKEIERLKAELSARKDGGAK